MAELDDTLPPPPPRPDEGHKGTFGRVTLVGGSPGMAGSIALSGMAALRSGAGLVTVEVPESILPTVAAFHPAMMTQPRPNDWGRDRSGDRDADAVGLGPGLGRGDHVQQQARAMIASARQPLVVDADALWSLRLRSVDASAVGLATGKRVITPHPGEFARIAGCEIAEVAADRRGWAERAAAELGCVVVLKGPGTIVTDGVRTAVNRTGNSGMATGGTGDVLTGILAALLAQRMPPWDAARLAVHVHGRAGDLAADHWGRRAMTAADLIDALGPAWGELE